MIDMYVLLVINKKRTCDETNRSIPLVPVHLRSDVLAVLRQRGYDANGNQDT